MFVEVINSFRISCDKYVNLLDKVPGLPLQSVLKFLVVLKMSVIVLLKLLFKAEILYLC